MSRGGVRPDFIPKAAEAAVHTVLRHDTGHDTHLLAVNFKPSYVLRLVVGIVASPYNVFPSVCAMLNQSDAWRAILCPSSRQLGRRSARNTIGVGKAVLVGVEGRWWFERKE